MRTILLIFLFSPQLAVALFPSAGFPLALSRHGSGMLHFFITGSERLAE